MERRVKIWAIGALAGAFSIASSILNVVFATNVGNITVLSALRALLYVTFGASLVNIAVLALFCTSFVKKLDSHSLGSKAHTWSYVASGTSIAVFGILVSGVVLVWLAMRQSDLPTRILQAAPTTLIGIWFATWAIASVLQIVLYCLLHSWVRNVLTAQRASRLDMDFRARAPSLSTTLRPTTQHTTQSFGSQEPTLHSSPRTPISKGESLTRRRSSSVKVGAGSSSSKVVRYSNQWSSEAIPFPAREAMSPDSAFDDWDTSSVHREMRAAIHSSPPPTSGGLETIPGSPAESTILDGPFLPEPQSPISSSPPHAATSDTAVWSSPPGQLKSSPPSSPINFSRPTSRPTSSYNNKQPPPQFEPFESPKQELIHPLFRLNGTRPPPIPTAGTMVTASPMANTLITPKTLARLRSNSPPVHKCEDIMPSIDKPTTDGDEPSVPDSPALGVTPLGSPGPSIVDEDELPPILPGFVLSAGSRTSLVGYGKRKSIKKGRTKSSGSVTNRLSQIMV
ncbi:hypothetical protein A1O7_07438 [Cladophialophora yegresii CBS 114405]|uniref:Uncharacterized protein n=1 Tax=Cladophialophora yegresii CBS 114405 TaxID=1182544 RepID=W9WEZ3_9EURO|nr:uncharacterized protein A1O7_07438 [Cladophialophora yegresii CBS 114405]EXJ57094.1 hypothetical protein A1O7_07438 [Cladophialophora yegresii CBS 114405]